MHIKYANNHPHAFIRRRAVVTLLNGALPVLLVQSPELQPDARTAESSSGKAWNPLVVPREVYQREGLAWNSHQPVSLTVEVNGKRDLMKYAAVMQLVEKVRLHLSCYCRQLADIWVLEGAQGTKCPACPIYSYLSFTILRSRSLQFWH